MAFLYTNSKREYVLKKTIPFTTVSQKIKFIKKTTKCFLKKKTGHKK